MAPAPQASAPAGAAASTAACAGPQFTFETWEGGPKKTIEDVNGWPRVLVLSSSSSTARPFQIQVCLPAPYAGGAGTPNFTDHTWVKTSSYESNQMANAPTHAVEDCYTVNTDSSLLPVPTPSTDGSVGGFIRVSFDKQQFASLLSENGTLLVGYKTTDASCSPAWDQASLKVYERSTVKMLAGALYSVNQDGGFSTSGEAAVRFQTRFSQLFTGDADFWYDGIGSSSSKSSMTTPSKVATKASSSSQTQTFNPFSSSNGVFRSDLTLGVFLLGRPVDKFHLSFIGGGGFTSNRMPPTATVDTTTPATVQTAPRFFAGLRLVLPSLSSKGVNLSKPRARLQLSYAHDNAWRFTASDGTAVDKPNRVVAEGDFDFYEVAAADKTNVLVSTHLRWDAPASANGGPSDLRISVLMAVNLFDL